MEYCTIRSSKLRVFKKLLHEGEAVYCCRVLLRGEQIKPGIAAVNLTHEARVQRFIEAELTVDGVVDTDCYVLQSELQSAI